MHCYSGVVQKGGGYGRTLGFPTANIVLEDAGVSGIFAARVKVGGSEYGAAVYADQRNKVLESHLLDFAGELYEQMIEVELLRKIREDQLFASDEEAREVIAADVQKVRQYFRMP